MIKMTIALTNFHIVRSPLKIDTSDGDAETGSDKAPTPQRVANKGLVLKLSLSCRTPVRAKSHEARSHVNRDSPKNWELTATVGNGRKQHGFVLLPHTSDSFIQ
jgi:hypothetical protein